MKIILETTEVAEAVKAYVASSMAEEMHVGAVQIPAGEIAVLVQDTTIKFTDKSEIAEKSFSDFEKEQLNKAGKL